VIPYLWTDISPFSPVSSYLFISTSFFLTTFTDPESYPRKKLFDYGEYPLLYRKSDNSDEAQSR
jgi:hypothetical protein